MLSLRDIIELRHTRPMFFTYTELTIRTPCEKCCHSGPRYWRCNIKQGFTCRVRECFLEEELS